MKQIEVGKEVKILANFYKFTAVEIKDDNVVCEFKDKDGLVQLVTLPKSLLGPADVGFLDIL
ncbi:MAG: hypothetical protein ACTIMQ_13765 [Acinetobacter guillouiae]